MANVIYTNSVLSLASLDASCVTHQGLQLAHPEKALAMLSGSSVTVRDLAKHRPTISYTGVQSAPSGMIQDPAGVSIGSGERPHDMSVGGASQQIYMKFADLEPVPAIPVGASVFNTSVGAGARVLHTYSPQLAGNPVQAADCKAALEQLASSYANSFHAALNPTAAIKASGNDKVLHLSPIAGKIFAGNFRDTTLDHLHPTYTLMAIMLAQASLLANKQTPPPCVLHYYQDAHTYQFDQIADSLADDFYSAS
jgi:hypothetical protein